VLDAGIGKDGRVRDVTVKSGHPLLTAAAVDAVKRWVFRPAMLNGQPSEGRTQVEVRFDLSK
jgi:protein TonB